MKLRVPLAAVAGALLPALLPHAVAAPQADAIAVYSGGVDEILVDPKDQGLAAVLHLLDDRILDLPAEVGDPNMPAPLLSMLVEALFGPMQFRAGVFMPDGPMMGPPIAAQLDLLTPDVDAAEAKAAALDEMLAAVMPGMGEAVPAHPSLQSHDLEGTPFIHGPMRIGRRSALTLALNDVSDAPLDFGELDLPNGVDPCFALRFDASGFAPLVDMIEAQAGPQGEMIRQQLEMYGLAGEDAIELTIGCGHGRDRAYTGFRLKKYNLLIERMGLRTGPPLGRADLRLVPADATFAQVSSFDVSSYLEMVRGMIEQQAEMTGEEIPDPIEMIAMMTGVNIETEIVAHLGTRFGMYLSDRTGGGGLLSAVGFMEVTNEEAIRATFERLTGMANAIAQQNAKGYVRFTRHEVDGQRVMVLMFPGLPVPLEICFAMRDGFLFAALTESGLLAALEQTGGRQPNLADNPRFREMGGLELDGALQVTFLDTPRTIRDGYGIVSLGMSALSNLTRSPGDPERGVYRAMPSFGALTDGAKAMVEVISIEGPDLVARSQYDRSMLVNACGLVGVLGGSTGTVATAALGAGILIPSLAKARQNALQIKRASQYQMLGLAVMTFASEHGDGLPESIEELVRGGYLKPGMMDWEGEPAPDDGPDLWMNTSLRRLGDVRSPDRTILAYDRAMLLNDSKQVVVLFFDGHVEMLDPLDLLALMGEPHHEGVDFQDDWSW